MAEQVQTQSDRMVRIGALKTPLTRRTVVAASAAIAAAGLTRGVAGAQDDITPLALTTPYRASVALNLRAGPGTGYRILLVIPAGAQVTGSTETANGYRKVTYAGSVGWAIDSGLSTANDPGSGDPGYVVGQAVTTAALNLRAGPSTLDDILQVIPQGATVDLFEETRDGFRRVAYRSTVGWVSTQYLRSPGSTPPPSSGVGTATTTAAVNLRAQPSLSAQVLRVVPAGAGVTLRTEVTNGFRAVVYGGTSGYIFATYLSVSGAPQRGTAKTTTALNLRAEPSTSARVLLVMPAGAEVVPTDQLQNGFRKVSYNGTTGWAFNTYLVGT